MPPLGLLSLVLGLLAAGALTLYLFKRRELRALDELSTQLSELASQQRFEERLRVTVDQPRVERAASAVNQILTRLDSRGQKLQEREQLFQKLVEAVHEAVVLHRETI